MTEKELNQLYFLNIEIKRLQNDLLKLLAEQPYSSPIITDMPHGGVLKDFSACIAERVDLERLLSLNIQKAEAERDRLERYISSIHDAEVRLIMRLRHIEFMTWEDIGDELNMHHTTVIRKYRRYLKVAQNAQS